MGALKGLTIIEMAGIGPAPFAAMLLADQGAEVIRIDRPGGGGLHYGDPRKNILNRGRKSLALDLKSDAGREAALRIIEKADGLIEGFRPGVMEKMGLGPDACLTRNRRLVYGRMTGWGQDGPLAEKAGHDINYIALAGALAAIGPKGGKPTVPLNLIGDFGGGALYLVFGMLCGLLYAQRTGEGQIVDAAMVDGVASLMSVVYTLDAAGIWQNERGRNLLDGGAPFYDVYETSDGQYLSVGPLEPQFFAQFRDVLGLAGEPAMQRPLDLTNWPDMRRHIAQRLSEKTCDEWMTLFSDVDACVAPVLDYKAAPLHPHMEQRKTFIEKDGLLQPNVAPRLSKTPGAVDISPAKPGEHSREILDRFGFTEDEAAKLLDSSS